MTLNQKDLEFITLALKEAQESFDRKDFPVGAVIAIDDSLLGKSSNANYVQGDWNHHAETGVINRYSRALKQARKDKKTVSLYTTLEPCIMCLGSSIMNRVGRIIYACPDPNAGACDTEHKKPWYIKHQPEIIALDGELKEKSYQLLTTHMRSVGTWTEILETFEQMHQSWK